MPCKLGQLVQLLLVRQLHQLLDIIDQQKHYNVTHKIMGDNAIIIYLPVYFLAAELCNSYLPNPYKADHFSYTRKSSINK